MIGAFVEVLVELLNGRYYLVLAVEALVVVYVGIMESGMALLDINNWGIGGGGVGWWSVDDDVMSVMVDETWLQVRMKLKLMYERYFDFLLIT